MFGEEKVLLATTTGEPHQPARIYYEVNNRKTVLGAFKKLRCMEFDPTHDRWVWLYEAEAKKLKFENSYNKIAKDVRPVVIGFFVFRGDREMLLELRSFERVTKALVFFDKRINRRAAKAVKLRICNRLFSSSEEEEIMQAQYSLDYFFERDDIEIPDPDKFEADLERLLAERDEDEDDSENNHIKVIEYLEEQAKQPLPEIEEIPLHFYTDGVTQLELSLSMKTVEATEHWRGNSTFSQYDIIQGILDDASDLLVDEEEDEETFQ